MTGTTMWWPLPEEGTEEDTLEEEVNISGLDMLKHIEVHE